MTHVLRGEAAQSAGHTRLPARNPQAPAASGASGAPALPVARPAAPAAPVPAVPAVPAAVPRVESGPSSAELREWRERAHEAGFAQGLRDGQAQVAEAATRQAAAWQTAISALEADVARQLQHVEEFAVALAFEACSHVLGDAALDATQVAAVVKRLLAETRDTGLLRVQLSPADLDVVQTALQDDAHRQHRTLSFAADRTLSAGECRVVSAHGQLETGLGVQLDAIRQSLLAAFAERARARSA